MPKGVASAQMNIYYALSAMALERGHDRAVRRGRLDDPRIHEFMRRIAVTPSAEHDAMGNPYRYATRVTVITTQGDRRTRETLYRRARPRHRSPAPRSKTSSTGWRRAR